MLTLATGGTIAGKAGTVAAVTCTIMGDAVSTSDSFTTLYQAQLPNTATTLYTVPASTQALVKQIHLANTTGSDVTGIVFYTGGTAASNAITGTMTVVANGTAVYSNGSWEFYNAAGAKITSTVVNAAGVAYAGGTTLVATNVEDALDELSNEKAEQTITLAAGNGLTGGGTLAASRTFDVNPDGVGVEIAADAVQLKDNGVTNTKLSDMVTDTVKGRALSAGTGDPTDLSRTQLTALCNVATTSLPGNLSALDKKKLDNVWKDVVTDGGLDPTGAANCTVLLQTLHDALPATGGVLFFPQGTYRFDATVNITKEGVYLMGQGRRTVKLCTTSATVDMFNVTGDAVLFEGLRFTTMVSGVADNAALRTAGYAVNMTSSSDSSGMRKCDILFQWSGIQSSGSLHFFDDLNIREYGANAVNGACILVNGTGDRYITRLTTDNGNNPTGFAGIRVTECASLVISDSNIIHAGTCLALEPATGKTVPSVEVTNTFFDTSVKGMAITPAGTGTVLRSKFTNCWFGTHTTAGVEMNGTQWDGITFDNCEFYAVGPTGTGISCPTGGGKWKVANSRFAGFVTAISVTASAAHFPEIYNCTIGPQSAFGLNTTGINVGAGTYKGLIIQNNSVVNNTTNLTLGAVTVTTGEYGFYRISDNAGINPKGVVTTPAVAASTVANVNTTGFRVQAFIKNGSTTPSAITKNGVTLTTFLPLASLFYSVNLDPGDTITFTYTVVPTWVWVGV